MQSKINVEVYKKMVSPRCFTAVSPGQSITEKNKSTALEMRLLRKIDRIRRRNRIRNTLIFAKIKIKPVEKVIDERPDGKVNYIE